MDNEPVWASVGRLILLIDHGTLLRARETSQHDQSVSLLVAFRTHFFVVALSLNSFLCVFSTHSHVSSAAWVC